MNDTQTDKYHDANGRPLAPPAPEPSQTSKETLQAWQRATLARAAARQERRATYKELGPLHNPPAKQKAERREQLADALGVDPSTATQAKATINAAFPPATPPQAGEPEQPPAEKSPRWTATGEHRHNQAVAAHNRACTAADRAMAEQAVKETLARPAPPTPVDPPPAAPDPSAETTASADRAARRRAASLKAAATVRARREAAEFEQHFQAKVSALVEIAQDRYHRAEAIAAEEQAIKAANPGIHTPRELLAYARASNVEPDLYRLAHIARQSQQPSQWSPVFRREVVQDLNRIITSKTPKPKGTQK